MEENSIPLAFGALSGAWAVVMLLVLGSLWSRTLVPMWRQWRYQGVNIAGRWTGLGTAPTPAAGEWNEVALTLQQEMAQLHGSLTLRHQAVGYTFDLELQVAGTVADGYVTLSMFSAGQPGTPAASALLAVGPGGGLTGQLLYRNPLAEGVDVIDVSVHRARSQAASRARPRLVAAAAHR